MEEASGETDKLQRGETAITIKYKDPHSFLCSTRWRTGAYIYLSLTILYMHRVNLSLAVVCMVDTTAARTAVIHINNTERDIHHNSSQYTNVFGGSNSTVQPNRKHNTTYSLLPIASNGSSDVDTTLLATPTTPRDHEDMLCGYTVEERKDWTAEIHWKKTEISFLLSSYFYGSFFTQIPAGTIADIFGGKHIVTTAMLVSAICSIVTPICARTNIILMFAVRIILGLAGGAVIPACMSMINVWSTPNERPLMISFCITGILSGTVIAFLTSGWLCVYGFDNGWPSIFYIHGCVTALFTCLWFVEGYSRPEHHPRISKEELEYIHSSRGPTAKTATKKTPWKRLWLSKPLWATILAHFSFNWSFTTIIINVPLFLNEVHKFDVKSNGIYSSVPFVFQIISTLSCGKLSGIIINKRLLGHLATRRLFTALALVGIGVCLISAGYISCEERYRAVILLCLSCVFAGCAFGGFFTNHPEYAGLFAGTAFGITNAGGVISSILGSLMAGLLTPNGLQEEWQLVFYIAAGINTIGALAFALCSDVHLQPWAMHQATDTEIDSKQESQELKPLNN